MLHKTIVMVYFALLPITCSAWAEAQGRLNILDYCQPGMPVDRQGKADASQAIINAIIAANTMTAKGEPACIYIPAGIFRIVSNPPQFARAGCVVGDGPTQSILNLDS